MKQELFKTLSRALLLACLMCTATSMSAEKVLIDGLYYTLSGNFGGATVEKPDSGMYVGDIDIPAEVTYNGVTRLLCQQRNRHQLERLVGIASGLD